MVQATKMTVAMEKTSLRRMKKLKRTMSMGIQTKMRKISGKKRTSMRSF
jgi:hypothetical protein